MRLTEIIKEKIKKEGPLSFHDFMDMALYYPDLGYYTCGSEKIGKAGDFYTSCSLSPAFGAMIAKQLEEMWAHMGKKEFTIVEYGAGTGALCSDILTYLKSNRPFYEQMRYCIIEKSPAMRKKEKERIREKVTWLENIHEIKGVTGCVLSNELVDNFPVHQVLMQDQLMEVFVDYTDGFIEIYKPARPELKQYFDELKVDLPFGFRTEINLEAISWMKEISEGLKKGYVLTIDYGYPSHELYNEQRKNGTLTCYNRHHVNSEPFSNIGAQDITAHVNFSALCLWGSKNGLDYCGYRNQGDFLLALGFKDFIKRAAKHKPADLGTEAFIADTLINDMGKKFKVLIQQKELPKIQLSGLKQLS